MSETDLQNRILDYCAWRRLLTYHVVRSDKGIVTSKGFPDLVIVGNRVVFAELKSDKGTQTLNQQKWESGLRSAEAEFYLWRPSDWDRIVKVLDSLV